MESTVMISSLLCNILIGCFCIVVLSWAVVAIQTVINDFKREKREEKKTDEEEDEYGDEFNNPFGGNQYQQNNNYNPYSPSRR